MGNWSNPTLTSLYTDFLADMKARDADVATMFLVAPSNQPVGTMRFNRATSVFEEWSGAAWVAKPTGIAGGGTGSTTAAGARTNLGLGSIATQNANTVAITGGTLSGITSLSLSGPISFSGDNLHDIGTNAVRLRTIYIRSGAVAPVGVDKWVTA